MIAAGDESGRSQQGNNNAYCQDSPLTWLDWDLDRGRKELLDFVRMLTRLRREQPVFRRRRFFQGRPIRGADIKDIYWAKCDGTEMTEEDWCCGSARCLGMGLVGSQIEETGERGEPIFGDSFLILLNADRAPIPFLLGPQDRPVRWIVVFDTQDPLAEPREFEHQTFYPLGARSMAVLRADHSAKSAAPTNEAQ
jgi:glycogen operon protein